MITDPFLNQCLLLFWITLVKTLIQLKPSKYLNSMSINKYLLNRQFATEEEAVAEVVL